MTIKHTCKRVLMVSSGVVMKDAVAPAIIPPAPWTEIIVDWLGAGSSLSVPWPKNLPKNN